MNDHVNPLGSYLKERRARMQPQDFGFPLSRRRTPGLRREEIAQLAHVSATWYTWLEQGRGGAPSADVLDRLARAFRLTEAEREHLFLLAQNRPPERRPGPELRVTPLLQRVLDALDPVPAIIKTPEWFVLAGNMAARALFHQADLPANAPRSVLRIMFLDPGARTRIENWEAVARILVSTFRRDTVRAGLSPEAQALIDELSDLSPDFRRFWTEQDVHGHGEGAKTLRHPIAGRMQLDYATFAVDGQPDLSLVVFTPRGPEDRAALDLLIAAPL